MMRAIPSPPLPPKALPTTRKRPLNKTSNANVFNLYFIMFALLLKPYSQTGFRYKEYRTPQCKNKIDNFHVIYRIYLCFRSTIIICITFT